MRYLINLAQEWEWTPGYLQELPEGKYAVMVARLTDEEFAVFSDKSYTPEDPAEPHRRRAKIMDAVNKRGDMITLDAAEIDHAIEAQKNRTPPS
jgi:hypothetical protein